MEKLTESHRSSGTPRDAFDIINNKTYNNVQNNDNIYDYKAFDYYYRMILNVNLMQIQNTALSSTMIPSPRTFIINNNSK